MKKFIFTGKCRRQFLINYFETGSSELCESEYKAEENCCDNCKRTLDKEKCEIESDDSYDRLPDESISMNDSDSELYSDEAEDYDDDDNTLSTSMSSSTSNASIKSKYKLPDSPLDTKSLSSFFTFSNNDDDDDCILIGDFTPSKNELVFNVLLSFFFITKNI